MFALCRKERHMSGSGHIEATNVGIINLLSKCLSPQRSAARCGQSSVGKKLVIIIILYLLVLYLFRVY